MKKALIILLAFVILSLCGCSSIDGGYNETTVETADAVELGERENAKYFLQIDINPSVILGYAENENVVYIASNNKDGCTLLEKYDAVTILGEPINAAIGSIMTAAHDDGYAADGFEAAICFAGEEKGSAGDIMQIAYNAVETCDFDIKVTVENEREIVYSTENGISGDIYCEKCNGEGMLACDECDGNGERLITVKREKEVRNDYVCEICGGRGWIDDGMHGGELGNCDYCGGLEGKMPSADFRKKAYDIVTVDEEEMRRCDKCDGSCETECSECRGSGMIF